MRYSPGPTARTVCGSEGNVLNVPEGWELLPPGDAGMTRRVKAAGDHWIVEEKRGRKTFSKGVWAAAETIERIRAELEAERNTEGYAKRQAASARRRQEVQAEYVNDFLGSVVQFLDFHAKHEGLAHRLAQAVTAHATPVGSGTVARTKRIPVQDRAEAAVIAWMRHQTTAYDSLTIPRIKGKRREVRRMLAQRSKELLGRYRRGDPAADNCPLQQALPETAKEKLVKSGRYRHYKGNEYTVIGVARHSETDEQLVVYRPDYGERGLWVRPQEMFLESVEVDGQLVPRFQLIEADEA